MDKPLDQSIDQGLVFKQLTEKDAYRLRILVAKEQRGTYCPTLHAAEKALQSFLSIDTLAYWLCLNMDTNKFVSNIAHKNKDYHKLISMLNTNNDDLPRHSADLLQKNRYVANAYGSCKPYEDRIITPLHYVLAAHADGLVSDSQALEFSSALLSSGANPNARDDAGNTPMHHASTVEQVCLLCDHGARLNIQGESSRTPLLNSIRLGNWKVAECLLTYGANPNKQDDKGNTPFYQAVKQKSDADFIQLLLDHGADCTRYLSIKDIADEAIIKIIKKHVLFVLVKKKDVDDSIRDQYLMFYQIALANT